MQPRYWDDSQYNGDNQPVVGVSWYEALAYATWRGARLPSEREWEYAARGPNGLVYPWGDAWNPDNANYADTSPDEAFAVGSFPDGASWVGALDLSGNVWEWTLSEYRDYPYEATDGRENTSFDTARVLRGGAFSLIQVSARAAARINRSPDRRYSLSGFRVCRPPF